jgi:hypothetical protein
VLLSRASLDSFLSTSDHHKISTVGYSYSRALHTPPGAACCGGHHSLFVRAEYGGRSRARVPHVTTLNARMYCTCPQHQLQHACGYYLASQGHDTRVMQIIWGIRTCSIPCATPPWRPTDSNASGMMQPCTASAYISMLPFLQHRHCDLCYDRFAHEQVGNATGREEARWTLSRSWIR